MSIDYTEQLRINGELMASAVARDLDAHVPSCPDWNVAKLTIHTGQHHRWVADAIRRGGESPERPGKPGLRGDELVEWFRVCWSELADLLDASDDESPAWSWAGDNRVGFWRRRTALETLVHRWDAENAVGETSSLDPALSSDGVDEMLFVMAPAGGWTYKGPGARVGLATTDAGGSWTMTLEDGKTPVVARGSDGSPDVTFEAPAADLCLFLWGRLGSEVAKVSGDDALADSVVRWWAE